MAYRHRWTPPDELPPLSRQSCRYPKKITPLYRKVVTTSNKSTKKLIKNNDNNKEKEKEDEKEDEKEKEGLFT